MNGRARTASPAALATRPVSAPPIDADTERHGLGAVLLISKGRPCECGTVARGRHRCGTDPPAAADAERWHAFDQNSDHGHGPLRMRNRSYVTVGDWHKCRCTISSAYVTDRTGLSVRAYYHAAMSIQRCRHMSICGWAHNENDSHYHSHVGKIEQGA
jgi:hypothetical protein